jgi:serine/threonine protein kinase
MPNKIGRFDILGEVTRSPLGCVLKAQDPESGQTVALKTFDIHSLGEATEEALRCALAEADSTKVLNSHNLVLLFGAGEIDGQFCSSMEYVQGDSLANMLARGDEFSIWDLQDIVRQTCQGFDHAHSHKVVHHSLEPAKLMVQWDGTVKILGFGISTLSLYAAATDPASTILSYMSPEQVRGEELDGRSNLFTLGAILYEMVTRQKPFDGRDAAEIKANILNAEPTPPNQISPKLHALVSEVIVKSLAKDPGDRYQTGQELVNALERKKEETRVVASPAVSRPAEIADAASSPMEFLSAIENGAVPPPVKARAMAAIAGANGAAPARAPSKPAIDEFVSPAKSPGNSGSRPLAAVPGRPKPTKVPVDPAMAEDAPGKKAAKSFSDIEELPPMKERYAPAIAEVAAIDTVQELRQTQSPTPSREEKPKPAEIAKKAVEELRKIPPKLFLYSIGGALAIILLVIALIAARVHRENTDVDGNPPPSAPATATVETRPQQAMTQSDAKRVKPSEGDGDQTVITIKPKYVAKKATKAAPAPAPAIVPGQLTVNSVPAGAQITVDGHGEASWLTPYDLTAIAPGHHTVALSKVGFTAETRTVDVASHSRVSLFVQLAQLQATVLVAAEPAGAQILLDGHDTGRVTPSQISVEKPGNHTILIKKQGYLDENTTLNLQPGQSFHFAPTLRQLGSTEEIKTTGKLKKLFGGAPDGMGTVSVKTQPKGAQIAVNKHILDKNSPAEFFLNPGTYVIDITVTGYKSVHRIVQVEKNGKLAIEESMDRE